MGPLKDKELIIGNTKRARYELSEDATNTCLVLRASTFTLEQLSTKKGFGAETVL